QYGVRNFSFQSIQELEKLAQCAPGSNVYVRVKMDDAQSAVPLSSKYGCRLEDVIPLLNRSAESGLCPAGITFHVGSQQTDPNAWARDIATAKNVLKQAKAVGINAHRINIGGGFPARYSSTDPEISDIAPMI